MAKQRLSLSSAQAKAEAFAGSLEDRAVLGGRAWPVQSLDLTDSSGATAFVYDVRGFNRARCQVLAGTWSSAVAEVEYGIDGVTWYSFGTPVTFSADGVSSAIDVTGIAYLRVSVNTSNGGASDDASVSMFGESVSL